MATVINNPDSSGGGGGGWAVALIVIVLVVILFLVFGLPGLRRSSDNGGGSVNLPGNVNVNVNTPGGDGNY